RHPSAPTYMLIRPGLTAMDSFWKAGNVRSNLLLACWIIAPCFAQELKFADLGDFRLESGEIGRDCRIGYRTFGKFDENKSNAVLFPTWFTGTTKQLMDLIGAGKMIDSSKYFVIAV